VSTARDPAIEAVCAALVAPFDAKEVKWKPQMVKQNRCMAMAYIDARLVQDRLDEVLGVENWDDAYKILPDGSVVCRLRLFLGGRWVGKTDVGSTSEQPDAGDRMKAAFSDALKRAAVKFGIGRYLYRLPAQWVDYDAVKKQIAQVPQMPAWAIPGGKAQAQPARPAPQKPEAAPAKEDAGAAERKAMFALLTAKGKTWEQCTDWLNAHFRPEAPYSARTKLSEVPAEQRAALAAQLEAMCDAAPQKAQ
jgi:hypothetical protein